MATTITLEVTADKTHGPFRSSDAIAEALAEVLTNEGEIEVDGSTYEISDVTAVSGKTRP